MNIIVTTCISLVTSAILIILSPIIAILLAATIYIVCIVELCNVFLYKPILKIINKKSASVPIYNESLSDDEAEAEHFGKEPYNPERVGKWFFISKS